MNIIQSLPFLPYNVYKRLLLFPVTFIRPTSLLCTGPMLWEYSQVCGINNDITIARETLLLWDAMTETGASIRGATTDWSRTWRQGGKLEIDARSPWTNFSGRCPFKRLIRIMSGCLVIWSFPAQLLQPAFTVPLCPIHSLGRHLPNDRLSSGILHARRNNDCWK